MKRTSILSGLAAGLLTTAPAFAGQWDGNFDLQGSILNDLDKPAYVGTSATAEKPRIDIYVGFTGPDLDASGFAVGRAGPEKGQGDTYGWAVLDVSR